MKAARETLIKVYTETGAAGGGRDAIPSVENKNFGNAQYLGRNTGANW